MKLSALTTQYVMFKQSMGMRFRSEATVLKSFCRFLGDPTIAAVEPRWVSAFLAGKGAITPTWHQKFRVLTGFYRFAVGRGYLSVSPLPITLPKRPDSMTPYIYSREELCRLFDATQTLGNQGSPLQVKTFHTLLILLYATGLRVNEALSLSLDDVRLEESLLVVRDSKFFKSRLVPTGPRLTEKLSAYAKERRQLPCPLGKKSFFFATRTGERLSYDRVRKIFLRLRRLAGIRRDDGAFYQPRIHDLRHTFAVHRLVAWYREGADVQRLLPKLSTYLGHVEIASTQRYLTMTPELLQEANRCFERYVFPEVNHV